MASWVESLDMYWIYDDLRRPATGRKQVWTCLEFIVSRNTVEWLPANQREIDELLHFAIALNNCKCTKILSLAYRYCPNCLNFTSAIPHLLISQYKRIFAPNNMCDVGLITWRHNWPHISLICIFDSTGSRLLRTGDGARKSVELSWFLGSIHVLKTPVELSCVVLSWVELSFTDRHELN
jgi:hypothetical protein